MDFSDFLDGLNVSGPMVIAIGLAVWKVSKLHSALIDEMRGIRKDLSTAAAEAARANKRIDDMTLTPEPRRA